MPPPKALGGESNEFQGDVEVYHGRKRKGTLLFRLTDARAKTGCEKTRGAGTQLKLLPLKGNVRIPTGATLHPGEHTLSFGGFLLS